MLRKVVLSFLSLLAGLTCMRAQDTEPADSLVRLMSAQSVRMVQKENENFREVIGPARFLHNNTYLICDTAHWNVDTRIITAVGNVQIIQQETVLTSDNLEYVTDLDLARFRGSVVQLTDKDHNTLRTCFLDYNTKDSVAVFDKGGALKDKDGQVIESIKGTYDSKIKTFTFEENVNMYADSLFIKSSSLVYNTATGVADFSNGVDAWKDDNMVSSRKGWYDRQNEVLLFHDDAHVMTDTQEGWADSLYYFRNTKHVEMQGNAQVTDTSKNVSAVANRIIYVDSLSRVTLTDQAAVIAEVKERRDSVERLDTLYMGADRITLLSKKMYELSPGDTVAANTRLREMALDPVEQHRIKCAEEAAEAAQKAREEYLASLGMTEQGMAALAQKNGGNASVGLDLKEEDEEAPGEASDATRIDVAGLEGLAPADSTGLAQTDSTGLAPADSTRLATADFTGLTQTDSTGLAPADTTLAAAADSLVTAPLDSTEIRIVKAFGNVRLFKKDMQARCDSLDYCDLDSLARMYISPIIWNEGRRQYIADSIFISVRGNTLEKANLMSNAFITIQEDSLLFDQIRSTEMMAYFDSTSALRRFDALGEAAALFYMREDNEITMANKVETRMLSANFQKGDIDRIYYYDSPKNDAYPLVQLPRDERQMKGFSWEPDMRPASRMDITSCEVRAPQRSEYAARPRAVYNQTDRFFPGYMQSVYDGIAERKRLEAERRAAADTAAVTVKAVADSLNIAPLPEASDTVAVADSLATDVAAPADSLSSAEPEKVLSEREAKKLERERAREARYAELDRRDAEKAAAKEAKAREKQRRKALKFLRKEERRKAREEAAIQKYMRKYEEKLRKSGKTDNVTDIEDGNEEKAPESSGKLPPRIEARGKVSAPSESGQ